MEVTVEGHLPVRRLLLVRHAATPATRAMAVPADDPLDERGVEEAAVLRSALPARSGEVVCSPARRCLQTAEAAGWEVARVEPAVREADFGTWAGKQLDEIDPEAAKEWMADPAAVPHGGESLLEVLERVGGWLDGEAIQDGRVVVVTHAEVIRAAVVHALSAPPEAFWRVDVSPVSITELHAHDGRWTVTRVNATLSGGKGTSEVPFPPLEQQETA